MFLHRVDNSSLENEWLMLPSKLYEKVANKPLMLIDDVQKVFMESRNSFLSQGEYRRWIVYDAYNLVSGRIAAFAKKGDEIGRIGFFECIDDTQVAQALFNTCCNWLAAQGCKIVEGPVNFGEKDRFWGLMVAGFDSKGLYLDNFNPDYYQRLFEQAGFTAKEKIYTYQVRLEDVPVQRMEGVYNWSQAKYHFRYDHFDWNRVDALVEDIHSVYTQAFDAGKRIGHITQEDIRHLLGQAKPLLNEKHFWLAYRAEKPVGFLMFLNEPGGVGTGQKKLLKGFAFAMAPEVTNKGVEIGLTYHFYRQLLKENSQYDLMLSGINARSSKMNSMIEKLGGRIAKVHNVYQLKIN